MSELVVNPGRGLGPIKLGMSPAEVLSHVDEEQAYEEWMGGNLNDALTFRGMRLHFDKCDSHGPLEDSKLTWIVIKDRDNVSLFGSSMASWTRDAIIEELNSRGFDVEQSDNGDVDVLGVIGFGFSKTKHLNRLEIG